VIESCLADGVIVLHLLFVAFVLGGLLAIPAGMAMGAAWIRNPWFRWPHLAASIFLALRVSIGSPCPLSAVEHALDRNAHPTRWTDVLLFRSVEPTQFSSGVMAQGVMSGLLLIVCQPRWGPVRKGKSLE
jgi:hypothetical protein